MLYEYWKRQILRPQCGCEVIPQSETGSAAVKLLSQNLLRVRGTINVRIWFELDPSVGMLVIQVAVIDYKQLSILVLRVRFINKLINRL